jgi:HPr kinase/phosphorylase
MKNVTAAALLDGVKGRLNLKVLYGKEYLENQIIETSRIQRPGRALAGYFEHIRPRRVQLFGETEMSFMQTLAPSQKVSVLKQLASINKCLFVLSRNMPVPDELMQAAMLYNIPVVDAAQITVQVQNELAYWLDYELAPDAVMHGVCVEVYGLGIIIVGKSGIGKSECALELVKRGQRLVADDVVCIHRRQHYIAGSSNEILRNHIELRGIGVLNISEMFGITATRPRKKIDLIIHFMDYDEWNRHDDADRLGLSNRHRNILDIDVPEMLLPVSPGRNMADVVEMAVKNQMLKLMGHNSSAAFARVADERAKIKSEIIEKE